MSVVLLVSHIGKGSLGFMPFLLVCLVGLLVSVHAHPESPVVAGHVRLPDGSPVVGAQVVLFDVADLGRGPVGQATTDEAGQFALPLAAVGGTWVLPSEVALGPNYPNPFNPSTIIPYQLSASSPVRLEVFNVLGQRVATLVDDAQEAGTYRAGWDGTDALGRAAASGVYFYRLTVAGVHRTGKMVLLDGQAGVPLGGPRVEALPLAAGSSSTYGLVVSGARLVPHVDSEFGVAAEPVAIELVAPQGRMKVVPTMEGLLGDINTDGRVDIDDGLVVAMYSVNPSVSLPNHGLMTLGDVNCNGQVELADAGLIATYVVNPSDASVSSLRIGQRGGYSLDPVTEMVWGSILGTNEKDAVVARILDGVPVLVSGVMSDNLYLGIDRTYWTKHGGKHIYEALKQRFPATPIHVEPSVGIIKSSGKVQSLPTTTALRRVAPVTVFGPPMSFSESPHAVLEGPTKQQRVVGRITVPDDVTVGTVSVAVDITHPFKSDLKIDLVAPSGVAATLYDGIRAGINPEANIVGELPMSTELQGQAAKGTWQLRVGDYEPGDSGTLNSWTLTVTPAQDEPSVAEPANLFLETFQEGLSAWQGARWEAASLESDEGVPGEGPGNIVAKTQGCSVCFLNLQTPIDLSAHDSVTLSFYRWLDPGMGANEFLGIDIGNNGSFQRLENWGQQDADGAWHLETFTLSGDQISDTFSLRFFSITTNTFTTVALDNVMISATPGTVVVEPVPEETDPDLAVTGLSAPATATPGQRISFQANITNTNAPAGIRSITLHRHTSATENPQEGGLTVTSVGALLQTDASRTVQIPVTAPSQTNTYHYYACISALEGEDTENNCASTVVTVQEQEDVEEEEPEALSLSFVITPTKAQQPV